MPYGPEDNSKNKSKTRFDDDAISIRSGWRFSPGLFMFGTFAVGAGLTLASLYRTARSNQRLVRTGLFLKGIHISQTCFHIPYFQTFVRVSLEPCTYKVPIEAMSKERISFHMPTVWTIAPKKDEESIRKYAERMVDMDHKQHENFFAGIIEGEGRIIAGGLELDQLQGQREQVRDQLMGKLGPDFLTVGCEILNVNVAELVDTAGQEYFAERRKRALSEAMNTARTAVAEATLAGDTGVAKANAETRERVAEYNRQAVLAENKQTQAVWESKAQLAQTQSKAEQTIAIAKSNQIAQSQQKESEFQKQVEEAKQSQEVAKQRAQHLSLALVEAEKTIATAKGVASALMEQALGEAKSIELKASAQRFQEEQRAIGIEVVLKAQASGLKEMVLAAGGDVHALNNYLLVEQKALSKIMEESAKALSGLKPNITVSQWNRDKNGENVASPLTELMTMAPQMAKEMERITGWQFLPQLFANHKVSEPEAKAISFADTTK